MKRFQISNNKTPFHTKKPALERVVLTLHTPIRIMREIRRMTMRCYFPRKPQETP